MQIVVVDLSISIVQLCVEPIASLPRVGQGCLPTILIIALTFGAETVGSCEYQMTSSSQGNGECVMSDGAHYKAHIGG